MVLLQEKAEGCLTLYGARSGQVNPAIVRAGLKVVRREITGVHVDIGLGVVGRNVQFRTGAVRAYSLDDKGTTGLTVGVMSEQDYIHYSHRGAVAATILEPKGLKGELRHEGRR